MIVAVSATSMMQMAVYKVIHMVAMRNRCVTAIGCMLVLLLVVRTFMTGRAFCLIGRAHADLMFVYMVAVLMMQMVIVQIAFVIVVTYGGVPATGAVLMVVTLVCITGHVLSSPHSSLLYLREISKIGKPWEPFPFSRSSSTTLHRRKIDTCALRISL